MSNARKRTTPESLNKLLVLYDKNVRKFLLKHPTFSYRLILHLTPDFLKTCRKRIIEGHKKYGDDWKYKDHKKEAKFEEYDLFNYPRLDECKQEYQKSRKRK